MERATSLPGPGETLSPASPTLPLLEAFENLKTSSGKGIWRSSPSTTVSDAVEARLGHKSLEELCARDGLYIPGDKLRIVKRLGVGSFAEVAIAEYLHPAPHDDGGDGQKPNSTPPAEPQLVAVKVLLPHVMDSERDVIDFIDENRVLLLLRHPHIVRFIGMGALDCSSPESQWRTLYMVQEYMSGGTIRSMLLKQMVDYSRPLYSYADALRWCIHVADALVCMHGNHPRVIHRDLKTENILLTVGGDGGGMVAKIADFGLHALVQPGFTTSLTQSSGNSCSSSLSSGGSAPGAQRSFEIMAQAAGAAAAPRPRRRRRRRGREFEPHIPINPQRLHMAPPQGDAKPGNAEEADVSYMMTGVTGSFMYMAPEVLLGQPYNESVDVFSFGIILYELFSRRLLSAALSNTNEFDESKGHAHRVAAGFRPPFARHIPPPVCQLIDACWSGVPRLRPGMAEVLQRLRDMQAGGVGEQMDAPGGGTGGTCCAVM